MTEVAPPTPQDLVSRMRDSGNDKRSSRDTALNLGDLDLKSLPLRQIIGYNGRIRNGLVVHPMGKHLIYPVGNNLVVETIEGKENGAQQVLYGHTDTITALAVSTDGKYLASGQEVVQDQKANVILWDWCSRSILMNTPVHKRCVEALAFTCVPKHLVSLGGVEDEQVVVWNLLERRPVVGKQAQLQRAGSMHCLAASKLEANVFFTVGDSYGRIWTLDDTKNKLSHTELHFGAYYRVVTSLEVADYDNPDLPIILCGTTSSDIVVLHARSGYLLFVVGNKAMCKGVTAVTYSRMMDGNTFNILVGTGEGKVINFSLSVTCDKKKKAIGKLRYAQGKKPFSDSRDVSGVTSIAKIGAGHTFYVGTRDCSLYRFQLERWVAELLRTGSSNPILAMTFPKGTDELLVVGEFEKVRVLNVRVLLEVRRYVRANRTCHSVAVSSDGTLVFSGWDDGITIVLGFELATFGLKELYRVQPKTHRQAVTALAVTSKTDLLLTGGNDGIVQIWRLVDDLDLRGKRIRQGLLLHQLVTQAGAITSAQISPDDKICMTTSFDGTTAIYDVAMGTRQTQVMNMSGRMTSAVFCYGGLHVITASGDGTIKFHELVTNECVRDVRGCLQGAVNSVDVDTCDRRFVSGGDDGLVKVWRLEEGDVTHVGRAHSDRVTNVRFGPCGSVVVSGCQDGSIGIWNVPV